MSTTANNKAKYTSNIRNYVTSSMMTSLNSQPPASWSKGKLYKIGDVVLSDGKEYIATSSGNTGDNPPIHTSGTISQGKVSWLFMKNSTTMNSVDCNLYLALGGTKEWDDESNPPEVQANDVMMTDIKSDILTLVKLDSGTVRYGLKQINWAQNTVYDSYDPKIDLDDPLSYPNGFYVFNSNYDIYKCIDNGGDKPSLIEPSGRDVNLIDTNDGYIWKYMGSVERTDVSRFLTPQYAPIQTKTYDDGSEQWKVQQNAKNGAIGKFDNIIVNGTFASKPKYEIIGSGVDCVPVIILNDSGGIDKINVFNGGENYDENTYITVFEDGVTGEGAQLNASIVDGVIDGIEIISGGKEYSVEPTILIIGDGEGAQLEVTINSTDGSINNVNIVSGGSGYTYAKVVVIKGTNTGYANAVLSPSGGHGYNIITELGSRTLIISCKNSPDMIPYILTGEESTYRQISLISSVKTNDNKSPMLIAGTKHPMYDTLDKYNVNSGYVIWVDNRSPVTRSKDQEEYIKITLNV